mmetsp:Transcript_7305/g.8359  ORF Transcript_7305/g.8359 Transcript_7305/m.8359 type:complete len:105 (+) Transcript_7305:709-1023(+)
MVLCIIFTFLFFLNSSSFVFMRRLTETHKKISMLEEDEPDFSAMNKENPLLSDIDVAVDNDIVFPPERNGSMHSDSFNRILSHIILWEVSLKWEWLAKHLLSVG